MASENNQTPAEVKKLQKISWDEFSSLTTLQKREYYIQERVGGILPLLNFVLIVQSILIIIGFVVLLLYVAKA
ncbi:MAG: hypothetical protein WCK82_04450 [Bacteroidota bacterium]